MPIVNANGIEIYYETAGPRHAPPLLLIQGLTGYTKDWAPQLPAFQDDFYVITFDNRGAGKSTQPEPGYTVADMAEDTAALLDVLNIPQAFIFGISMGGMIALNLAARHPAKVEKLALGCTTAGGKVVIWPEPQVAEAMTQPSTGDRRQDFMRDLWFLVGPEAQNNVPPAIERLADVAAQNPQTEMGFLGQFQAVATHDVTGDLGHLAMPVLVMHGQKDVLIPFANGRYLAEHIPGAEFAVYPRAGHLFYAEEAEAVNKRLRDFFCA